MSSSALCSSDIRDLPRRTAGIVQRLASRLGRDYTAGAKLPPLRDLAEQLGVATATAQRAVQAMVQAGLLVSLPRQGTFVAETLDPADLNRLRGLTPGGGRGLLAGRSITLVQAGSSVYGHRRQMADQLARALAGFGGAIGRHTHSEGLDTFTTDPNDEIIVFIHPVAHLKIVAQPDQYVMVLTAGVEPTVTGTGHLDVVSVDQHHGGVLAGEALVRAGCRRFCFLGRGEPPHFKTVDRLGLRRLAGLEQAVGASIPSELRLLSYGYSPMSGGVVFGKYMKLADRPDGVFAASDDIALGFVSAAVSQGLRAGHDFQLVGFDAQEAVRRLLPGGLASISLPIDQMSRRAAELIHQRTRQPDMPVQRLYLGGAFVSGESLRGPSPSPA